VSFKVGANEASAALLKMEACAKEIYAWMASNELKSTAIRLIFQLYMPNIARAHQYATSK